MQVSRRQCTAAVATGGDTVAPLTPTNSSNNKCWVPQSYWQTKEVTRIGYDMVFAVVAMPAMLREYLETGLRLPKHGREHAKFNCTSL